MTGGGEGADDECAEDVTPCEGGATVTKDMIFPKVPWNFDAADMTTIIEMKNRTRLTKHAKELLHLPCMAAGADISGSEAEICERRVNEIARRSCYDDLCQVGTQFLVSLRGRQCERLEVNSAEENLERQPALSCQVSSVGLGLPPDATFSNQTVYGNPSEFISALINALPSDEKLTREQAWFMAKFASACDHAYEDLQKPPQDRRAPTHILLLGQGGSGKTHVVQHIVFKAVAFILA